MEGTKAVEALAVVGTMKTRMAMKAERAESD